MAGRTHERTIDVVVAALGCLLLCTVGAVRGPGSLPVLLGEHVAATADRSVLGAVATFPGFLRDQWYLTRTWHVPIAAGKRIMRRLAHRGSAA